MKKGRQRKIKVEWEEGKQDKKERQKRKKVGKEEVVKVES